jgi:hypothetical protein
MQLWDTLMCEKILNVNSRHDNSIQVDHDLLIVSKAAYEER